MESCLFEKDNEAKLHIAVLIVMAPMVEGTSNFHLSVRYVTVSYCLSDSFRNLTKS